MRVEQIGDATLYCGDSLEIVPGLPFVGDLVDSVVTDPPYGLSFMGKRWDYDVPSEALWAAVLEAMKPGGHLLAFAGTRTQHRMAVRIEDAGFEIRDMIAWVYGSGFPKSLDVSKAIDKAAGAEREVVGPSQRHVSGKPEQRTEGLSGTSTFAEIVGMGAFITAPATDAARQWAGWGTALKPALEPITVARKPLSGTVAATVLEHGTGALNVDGCRINPGERVPGGGKSKRGVDGGGIYGDGAANQNAKPHDTGRWPANLIHDGSEEVLACFPDTKSGKPGVRRKEHETSAMAGRLGVTGEQEVGYGDVGSAARFFYSPKASKRDRDEGLEDMARKASAASEFRPNHTEKAAQGEDGNPYGRWKPRQNNHPTVKPTELMRYLCRLVTPPGGVVLDPFMGSGSTGKGAMLEGFRFIGIERDPDYFEIACRRIEAAYKKEN
jgi:site-specific DNA-methyltransferase (adenine-specific)